jgi:signal peptidase I
VSEAAGTAKQRTLWRDNIEALTVAILMAVVLKYFIVEAYKIPTGSMQPTLMGNDETNVHDRILVDKLSLHFRDPERFEVVVFKYPLDRSKNYVKRVVGMPGEWFRIQHGDVWTRGHQSSEWKVLRRPLPVQRETLKALDLSKRGEASLWAAEGARPPTLRVAARAAGADSEYKLRFQSNGPIRDTYNHGYPRGMAGKIRSHGNSGENPVGDLRVDGRVRVQPGCRWVTVELEEGARRYFLEIPGPAADPAAAPRIRWVDGAPSVSNRGASDHQVATEPYRLKAGSWVRFGAQNLDDELSLDVAGKRILKLDIPFATDQNSGVLLGSEGSGADFKDLQVYRDIYYTQGISPVEVQIPEGHYFMLGDNTQDSSDSREWNFFRVLLDGELVRGNRRENENPARGSDGEGRTFFRDEWGELHVFDAQSSETLTAESAPFVPRELITGRALAVFWPISFRHGVFRLKWIH